jgi:murein DD-endopeptidase MepM/ murein hydrolase activator NlpD
MVPIDTPRKRRNKHIRFLVIALMILTLTVSTASAATKKVAVSKSTKKPTTSTAKKAAATTTKKVTMKATASKTTTTKAKTQVKGEKITADKISVVGDNTISTYTVKNGDTLSSIAQKFDISVNTIRWSNNINSKDTIKPGQTLTILPTTGIIYTVKSGDTLSGIAAKFSADQQDILNANDLDNADSLKVGMKLAIPNTEPLDSSSAAASVHDTSTPIENISPIPVPTPSENTTQTSAVVSPIVSVPVPIAQTETPGITMIVTNPVTTSTYAVTVTAPTITSGIIIPANDIRGYYAQPVSGRLSQGIHAVNAVDIATPVGTTVHAAANGMVIVAMASGYNGGYGKYIVISHPNGTQTLYAHLSEVNVTLGEEVVQGEPIALSGNTGNTTGAHLHFEVRGATNPWGSDALGTTYSI